MKELKLKKGRFLIVADTQFPFQHSKYLDFCKDTYKKFKCDTVIHVGDVTDQMRFSFHPDNPNAPSTLEEVIGIQESFREWGKAFPNMHCIVGNHDKRIRRKLDSIGIPESVMPLEDMFRRYLKLPKGWTLNDLISIDTPHGPVEVRHGDARGLSSRPGENPKKYFCSLIMGHHHTNAHVVYCSNSRQLHFEMVVGCGIDVSHPAFDYQRGNAKKPILACGIMIDGIPNIIPMPLGFKR